MKYTHRLMVAGMLLIWLPAASHATQIRTQMTRNYAAIYDTSSKQLNCISEDPQRSWTAPVASPVPGVGDWSGLGTAAGPVFVYTSGNSVYYALLRFNTGKAITDQGNKPLTGVLAPGRLITASWKEADYGAVVTVVSLDGNKEYNTVYDINMWGTSKKISQSSRSITPQRFAIPGTKLSVEIPIGFSSQWNAGSQTLGILPQTKTPAGMLIHIAEEVNNLSEFADLFMKDIGPALGSPDMKQTANQSVSVGGSMQGLLRMARGTKGGKDSTFAFVFFISKNNTIVMVYGAPTENYDQFANIFYRLLGSIKVK